MNKSIGFIGGGRITRIILQAFKNKNKELDKIMVYDVNRETCKRLNQDFPAIRISDLNSTSTRDVIFIALHPPLYKETLNQMKKIIRQGTIVISLAPKITISHMMEALCHKNIIRFMPSATSLINKGHNPICFSNGFKEKQEILDLLSPIGKTVETEEFKLEAYAVISGMLPTYFWFQLYDLIDIASQIGLSGLESKEAVEQTMHAAIEIMFKTGMSKEEVLDLIPVKPLEDNQVQISKMLNSKLIGFFNKIKPVYEPML